MVWEWNILNVKILVKRKYAGGGHPEEDKNFKGKCYVQGNFAWEWKYSKGVHWKDNMLKDKIIWL